MVTSVRLVERAIGSPTYTLGAGERGNIIFRKSLFVVRDMKKGERFTRDNIRSIRPGNGLMPSSYRAVLGKKAAKDIARATPLSLKLIT